MVMSRYAARAPFRARGKALLAASVAAASLVSAAPVVVPPLVGSSDAAPRSADQLLKRYKQLSHQAEETAEAMNQAQDDLAEQRKILRQQRKAAAEADKRRVAAEKRMEDTQVKIDALARASYRGARVNRLYALLVSDSPQSLLDNMSDLEVVSRQASADMRNVKKTATDAADAKSHAEQVALEADLAAKDAQKKRATLKKKQAEMAIEASSVRALYQGLTGQQLAALRLPEVDFDPRHLPAGTKAALVAVRAAVSKVGAPYVWGATGPDSFDCSGLMLWAYKQAGVDIPRTSQAQLAGGTPVNREDLQPGDLVISYPAATHVAMYVGDGLVVHASTFGVPVAVVPIDQAGPYNSARRY